MGVLTLRAEDEERNLERALPPPDKASFLSVSGSMTFFKWPPLP